MSWKQQGLVAAVAGVMWMGLAGSAAARVDFDEATGFCGTIQNVPGKIDVVTTFQCSCAGKGQEWVGEVDLGAITWTSGGAAKSDSLGLLCQTYYVIQGFDSYVEPGNQWIKPLKEVTDFAKIATCGTSGCWSFLFFNGSGASCETETRQLGTKVSYVAVGLCPKPTELPAAPGEDGE